MSQFPNYNDDFPKRAARLSLYITATIILTLIFSK